jgi:signal transduction histidine kinase/Tfp pilus assembly protein PilF
MAKPVTNIEHRVCIPLFFKWLRHTVTVLSFTCCCVTANAGSPVDSLLNLLPKTTNDSLKARLLNDISWQLRKSDPPRAKQYAESALEIALRHNWLRVEAEAWQKIGYAESNVGNFAQAEDAQKKAIRRFKDIGDSLKCTGSIQALGFVYRQTGRFFEALNCQLEVARIYQNTQQPPSDLARCYSNIGNIFLTIKDLDNAATYYRKGLDLHLKHGSAEDQANSFTNLGAVLLEKNDLAEAEPLLLRALALFEQAQLSYGVAAASVNLGNVYLKRGQLEQAQQRAQTALDLYRKADNKSNLSETLILCGKIEVQRKNDAAALPRFKEALGLTTASGLLELQAETWGQLADLYSRASDYLSAYDARTRLGALRDSLYEAGRVKQTRELEARFQVTEKNKQIADYQENIQHRVRERNSLMIGIGALLLLLAAMIYLWWSRRKAQMRLQLEKDHAAALLTEKEALLDHLAHYQSQMLQQEKMASLGQLTAGIAHEINNPVNFISTSAQALRLDIEDLDRLLDAFLLWQKSNEPQQLQQVLDLGNELNLPILKTELLELMGSIERGARRSKDIVAGLSVFSRAELDETTPVDPNECINTALMMLNHDLGAHCRVEKQLQSTAKINAHSGKLIQAFVNIIANAIHAVKSIHQVAYPPTGLIQISTQQAENQLIIDISDNGSGMDVATRQRLFEPFFTTKPVGEGTGLGLSITYGIIRELGGTIQVESTPGAGTHFRITVGI